MKTSLLTFTSLFALASAASALPPDNDRFSEGYLEDLAYGKIIEDSTGATAQNGDPIIAGRTSTSTVWVTYVAPFDGVVKFYTSNANFDTLLGVYLGDTFGFTELASNDDIVPGVNKLSAVTIPVSAGTVYRVCIAGYNNAAGPYWINWDYQAPANDAFTAALDFSGSSASPRQSNIGATNDATENNLLTVSVNRPMWYKWTVPTGGQVTFSTAGADYDTVLSVFTGETPATATLVEVNGDIAAGDRTSAVTINTEAGMTYHLCVGGEAANGNTKQSGHAAVSALVVPRDHIQVLQTSSTVSEKVGQTNVPIIRVGTNGHSIPVVAQITRPDGSVLSANFTFGPQEDIHYIPVTIVNDAVFHHDAAYYVELVDCGPLGQIVFPSDRVIHVIDDESFNAVAANFSAVLQPAALPSLASAGLLTLKITASGAFSGKLTLGNFAGSVKGQLDAAGHALVALPRKNLPPVQLDVQMGDGGQRLSAQVIVDGLTSSAEVGALTFTKNNPVPLAKAGRMSFIVAPTAGANEPHGYGYGTGTLERSGVAKFAGVLADGTPFSFGGSVDSDLVLSAAVKLYGGKGFVLVEPDLDDPAAPYIGRGAFYHRRPAGVKDTAPSALQGGFEAHTTIYFDLYTPPAMGKFPTGGFTASGGDGRFGVDNPNAFVSEQFFHLFTNGNATPTVAGSGLSLKVTPATGLYKGAYVANAGEKPRPFGGVLVRDLKIKGANGFGLGFTNGPTNSRPALVDSTD